MLRSIVRSSLQFRIFIVVAAAALMAVGITRLGSARVDLLPEFGPAYVEVQTEALGLSAAEVEDLVTIPLEEGLLSGLPWVTSMRSDSIPGLSSIILVLEPGADPIRGRQMVQERLTQARVLPNVSKPPAMLEPRSSAGRAAIIGLSSKDLSMIDLGVLARWTIRPRLMGVPGVSNVAIWGQRERQVAVQVDPKRLREKVVTLDQVIETTGNALWVSPLSFLEASSPGAGGFIDTANQRLTVQHLLSIRKPQDLAAVRIEGCTGGFPTARRHVDSNCPEAPEPRNPLRIGDVATVVEDHQPLIGDAIVNDGTGLLLVIEKLPWANTPDVTRGVEAALEDLRPGLKGVEIDSAVFRPASFIEMARANLATAMLISGLLVIAALGALLFEWRRLAINLVAIPLSLVTAALVLEIRGVTLNAMVIAGLLLAVSVVVHDTVVGTDHLVRRLRQNSEAEAGHRSDTRIVVAEASLETGRSFAYAMLIVALSVIPIFALEGLSGAFLQPLVLSYGLAVAASFLVALCLTPALALLLFSKAGAERRESPLVRWAHRRYAAVLNRMLRLPQVATVAVVLLGAIGLVTVPRIGQTPFPSFRELNVLIRANVADGASLPAMMQLVGQASHELRAIPGVRTVAAGVGRAVLSDRVSGVSSAEIWVSIDPRADYDRTLTAVERVAARHPGLSPQTTTYSEDRMRAAFTGSTDDLVVRVYGLDFDALHQKAEEVRQSITQVDGIVAPRIDNQILQPTIDVEVDLSKAQLYGVKPGDVRRSVTSLISGISVGSLFEEQKVFDVVVIGEPELRQSVTGVSELLVDTLTGSHVPLGSVATVQVQPSPSGIKRDSVSRYVDVTAGVRGRNLEAIVGDVQKRLQAVQMPREFHAEVLGDLGKRQAAQQRFLGYALAAAVGIFLLLQAAFGSWRLAALAFLMPPVAVLGGLVAASLGGPLSLGSFAGCLAVIALAARDGILVISDFQRHRRNGDVSAAPDLLLRVSRERLPAVLTTAFVVGIPLVVLIVLGDRSGYEILRPMSIVVLGGLITSTALALFIMPTLCVRFIGTEAQRVPSVQAGDVAPAQNPSGA